MSCSDKIVPYIPGKCEHPNYFGSIVIKDGKLFSGDIEIGPIIYQKENVLRVASDNEMGYYEFKIFTPKIKWL